MKRGTPRHPKTLALARELKIPLPHAVGILEMLWHFTAEFAPQGDIGRFSDQDIAESVGWEGNPKRLIEALIKCRWLDIVGQSPAMAGQNTDMTGQSPAIANHGRFVIHDWADHCDDATRRRLKRRNLDFITAYEVAGKSTDMTGHCPTRGQGGAGQCPTFSGSREAQPRPKPQPEPEPEPVGVAEGSVRSAETGPLDADMKKLGQSKGIKIGGNGSTRARASPKPWEDDDQIDYVRMSLRQFMLATGRDWGMPDKDLAVQVLRAGGGLTAQEIHAALDHLRKTGKYPSESWGWFPKIVKQMVGKNA